MITAGRSDLGHLGGFEGAVTCPGDPPLKRKTAQRRLGAGKPNETSRRAGDVDVGTYSRSDTLLKYACERGK